MKFTAFSVTIWLLCMFLGSSIAYASTMPNDIVLMIDNSGSMKKGDPYFLTKKAVAGFVNRLSDDTRVAVLIFDQHVSLAISLTLVSDATKEKVLASLDRVNYRGQLTDIPSAMELALRELKYGGRKSSQKSIIFITDGIVDTGDKQADIDKTKWLRNSLSEEAAIHGICIFGIAFTNSADFDLIKFLAQKTEGAYFRVLEPKEIPAILHRIHELIINKELEPVESVSSLLSKAPSKTEIKTAPIYVTAAPKPTPPPVKSNKINWTRIWLIVLVPISFAVIIFLLIQARRKPQTAKSMPVAPTGATGNFLPDASLRDLSGVIEKGTFNISEKVTRIGRKEQINHIAIDKETISRQHAIIEYKDYHFWIIDQDSSNGTFLNGKQITDDERLSDGDIISFDVYELEFAISGMAFDETVVDKTVFRHVHKPLDD